MIHRQAHFLNLNQEDKDAAARVGVVDSKESGWILSRNKEEQLCLSHSSLAQIKPVFIDFCSGKTVFKRQSVLSKKQSLTKAVGFKKNGDRLLDLTAGFGDDAMIFASLGFEVTSVERQPLIYLMLQDALDRFTVFDETDDVVVHHRLRFVHAEAEEYLDSLKQKFECVYVDPMFAEVGKSALSSGKMQVLQKLTDSEGTLKSRFWHQALLKCTDRLVVKRPLKAQTLLDSPTHSYKGKTIRYDMYKP